MSDSPQLPSPGPVLGKPMFAVSVAGASRVAVIALLFSAADGSVARLMALALPWFTWAAWEGTGERMACC